MIEGDGCTRSFWKVLAEFFVMKKYRKLGTGL